MGTVSLSDSNSDLMNRIAADSPRAHAILRELTRVATTAMEQNRREVDAACEAARVQKNEFHEPNQPHFEYMLLVSLRQNDMTADRLIALHDTVCGGNAALTAATALHSFMTRSPMLAETVRRAKAGLPYGLNPAAALQAVQMQFPVFATPAQEPAQDQPAPDTPKRGWKHIAPAEAMLVGPPRPRAVPPLHAYAVA